MTATVDPSIFKAYDIRGIYPDQIDEQIAYKIGRAFVTFIQPERIILGRDMRLSSESLAQSALQGVIDQGADVLDIGMVSTDQYYFACSAFAAPGLMVTASHNPKEYNGFKLVRKMPYLLSKDEGIREIQNLVDQNVFPTPGRSGVLEQIDIRMAYVEKILSLVDYKSIRPLSIVADTANGMVGPIIQDVFGRLPLKVTGLFLEPDGNLPNHGLDPLQPENRRELELHVVQEKADVGFAFDGDGDRFFAVDDRGNFIPGDFLTAILSEYLLEKEAGSKIIYDIRASWAVPNRIKTGGGIPLIERVGHAFIKKRMADENALFAGEVTGHYYFRNFFFADSGILPAMILLELLSRKNVRLSELLAPLEERYFISGEINSRVRDPQERMQALAFAFRDGEQNHLDGISVSYPTWHFNVRPSNTEPFMRLNLESIASKTEMEQRRDQVLSIIRADR